MKRLLTSDILRRAGWELRRTEQTEESPMAQGLKWLAEQGVSVKTVLDVGASDGRWTAACLPYFPDADYVLFEPQPAHNEALDRFAAFHPSKVKVIKKAVGGTEGDTFFNSESPFGGALTDHAGEHRIRVGLTTLDAALKGTVAQPPYLLKLDTHGFERSIFNGANQTLEGCEALIVEAYNFPHFTGGSAVLGIVLFSE